LQPVIGKSFLISMMNVFAQNPEQFVFKLSSVSAQLVERQENASAVVMRRDVQIPFALPDPEGAPVMHMLS
jgi:hypothetical protein